MFCPCFKVFQQRSRYDRAAEDFIYVRHQHFNHTSHHLFDYFILLVVFLHFHDVIRKVQNVESFVLSKQRHNGARGPVQPVTEKLPARKKAEELNAASGTVQVTTAVP